MQTKIENGNLVVTIPLESPRLSSSGKTLIVGGTGGNVVTQATIDGKPVVVGLNALIRRDAGVVRAELA